MIGIEEFIDDCLREHNEKRKLHGVPPLRHSRYLDETAQDWADQLITHESLSNSTASNKGEVGESISMRTSTGNYVDILGTEVVNQWYNDISNYDFKKASGPAGNFTQIIWANTKEVGFGKAVAGGKCVVVAHYRPPGNIRGRYMDNVFLPVNGLPGANGAEKDNDLDFDDPNIPKSIKIDYVKQPDGKEIRVKRETIESMDELGNITRKVREVYIDEKNNTSNEKTPSGVNRGASPSRTWYYYPAEGDEVCSSLSEDDLIDTHSLSADDALQRRALRNYTRQMVHLHNQYRLKHGVPKLKHNRRLSVLAQECADMLVNEKYLSNSGMVYNGQRLGENIISRWTNTISEFSELFASDAHEVIDVWYGESQKFQYGQEPESIQGIGSFCQMIWRSSRLIGVGRAVRVNGAADDNSSHLTGSASSLPGVVSSRCVVVCFYHPPGNVGTRFVTNVPEPLQVTNMAHQDEPAEQSRTAN